MGRQRVVGGWVEGCADGYVAEERMEGGMSRVILSLQLHACSSSRVLCPPAWTIAVENGPLISALMSCHSLFSLQLGVMIQRDALSHQACT